MCTYLSYSCLQFQHKIWSTLESDPLFAHPEVKPTLVDYRHLAFRRMQKLMDYDLVPLKVWMSRPEAVIVFSKLYKN